MNAHSPITRDELNLMLQEPFATRLRIPGIVQEEIARRMAKETAKRTKRQSVSDAEHESRIAGGQRLASTNSARSKALVAEQSLKILPLHHAGMTVQEISEIVGNGPAFVRKVIRENGFQPNVKGYARTKKDYSKLLKRAHSLRMDGLSWVDIGQAMGVSKTRIREAYNEWKAAK